MGTWAWSGCHKLGGTTGCQAKASTSGGNKVLTPLLTFRGCPSSSHPCLLSFCHSSPLSPNSRLQNSRNSKKKKKEKLPLVPQENKENNKYLYFLPSATWSISACCMAMWIIISFLQLSICFHVFPISFVNASSSLDLSVFYTLKHYNPGLT